MKQEREAWQAQVRGLDPSRFVFLDEANAKTTMTRLYGRAPRGTRVVDCVPDGRWESTTMLAGLVWEGAGPCLTYEGRMFPRCGRMWSGCLLRSWVRITSW